MKSNISKCQRKGVNDNKKAQSLNGYEVKDAKYVFFSFYLRKQSNCITDLGQRIGSLNHLVYIPKFGKLNNF